MSERDQSAASNMRRRTSCIYCGRKIERAEHWKHRDEAGHFVRVRDRATVPSDYACSYHNDLPALDLDYRERL